jgi:membrane protein EpsK
LILFPELIRNLVDTVCSVLNPAIVARYAQHDLVGLRTLSARSMKLLAVALALPVGLLCGLARPFLALWLGAEFQKLDLLLIVLVAHLAVNLPVLPLAYVLTCYNKMKTQGTATLGLGIVNVLLAIGLAVGLGWGALGVAVATALVFSLKNMVFLTGYSATVMRLPWWTFYPTLVGGAVGLLAVGASAYGLTQLWPADTWLDLIGIALVVSVAYGLLAWMLGLTPDERRLLVGLCPQPMQRYLIRVVAPTVMR